MAQNVRYAVVVSTPSTGITNTSFGLVAGVFRWISGGANLLSGSTWFYAGILTDEGVGEPKNSLDIGQTGGVSASNTARITLSNALDLNGFLLDNSLYLQGNEIRIFKVLENSLFYPIWSGIITGKNARLSSVVLEAASSFQKILRKIPSSPSEIVTVGEVRGAKTTSAEISFSFVSDLFVFTDPDGVKRRTRYSRVLRVGETGYSVNDNETSNIIFLHSGEKVFSENELAGKYLTISDGVGKGYTARIVSNDQTGTGPITAAPQETRVVLNRCIWSRPERYFPVEGDEFPSGSGSFTLPDYREPFRSPSYEEDQYIGQERLIFPKYRAADHYDYSLPLTPVLPRGEAFASVYEPTVLLYLGDPSVTSVSDLEGFPIDGGLLSFDATKAAIRVDPSLLDGETIKLKRSVLLGSTLRDPSSPWKASLSWNAWTDRAEPAGAAKLERDWDSGKDKVVAEILTEYSNTALYSSTRPAGTWLEDNLDDLAAGPLEFSASKLQFARGEMAIRSKFPQTGASQSARVGCSQFEYRVLLESNDPTRNIHSVLSEAFDDLRVRFAASLGVYWPKKYPGDYVSDHIQTPVARLKLQLYRITEGGRKLFIGGQATPVSVGDLDPGLSTVTAISEFPDDSFVFRSYAVHLADPEQFVENFEFWKNDLREMGGFDGSASSLLASDQAENCSAFELAFLFEVWPVMGLSDSEFPPATPETLPALLTMNLYHFDLVGEKRVSGDSVTWSGTSGISGPGGGPLPVSQAVRALMEKFDGIAPATFTPEWDTLGSEPLVSLVVDSVTESLEVYNSLLALGDYGVWITADRQISIRKWLSDRATGPKWVFDETNILERSPGEISQSPLNEVYNELEVKTFWDGEKFGRAVHIDGTLAGPFPGPQDYPESAIVAGVDLQFSPGSLGVATAVAIFPYGTEVEVGDLVVWNSVDPLFPYSNLASTVSGVSNVAGGIQATLDQEFLDQGADSASGQSVELRSGGATWQTYAEGVPDYATAKTLWTRLSRGYSRSGTNRLLQREDRALHSDEELSKYLDYLTRWNTFQKNSLSFRVALDSTQYELLDPVEVSDELATSGATWFGWITRVSHPFGEAEVELEITFDIDPREICPDLIWDEGDGAVDPAQFSEVTEGDGVIDPSEYPDVDEQFDFDCSTE